MLVHSSWERAYNSALQSDSSGSVGYGAIYLNEYFSIAWPNNIPRSNLTLLELYPIMISTIIGANKINDKWLTIKYDNLAVVQS